ncbi:MAG: hypothetical protein QG652_584 [Pseudomonadota bacterium]|nr:hypothetical protein [Pseudomonadota bacterium]
MNRHMKKHQSGFTLIEIAIVMVIIGLLLGGVLKGQEMINSAKVRSLNNKMDGITAAWFAFQDRYRAIPGDMINANTQIAGVTAAQVGDSGGTVNSNAERGFAWVHLSAAGFLSGSYNGAAAVSNFNCPIVTCPNNGFGQGMLLTFDNMATANAGQNAAELLTGDQIPVGIVAELDRKIDDGLTNSGSIRAATAGGAQAACVAAPNYDVAAQNTDCGLAARVL